MDDAMETNRRQVLRWAGSGLAVAVAGCSAISGGSNRPAGAEQKTERTNVNTVADESEPAVAILESGFETVEKIIPPDDVVWGTLKNTGEKHITTLEVVALFRNEAGTIIDTPTAHVEGLELGSIWQPYIPSFETPKQVATGELAIKKVVTGPPPEQPDAATVVEGSLHPPFEFKQPAALGEVENTGKETIAFTVRASFYGLNDNLLDTGSVELTGVSPAEIREFKIEFGGYKVLAAPQVASYEILLLT